MEKPDILVVGAGPAGLTAGLYGARSGHRTLVLEGRAIGGQVALTSEVENYPGFSEPISGPLLMQSIEQQARRFGCIIDVAEVTGLEIPSGCIHVRTTSGVIQPMTLIIATGTKPRSIGVPGEKELTGRGVSYCAICDGPLFKGRDVAVIGGGDSALDEAYYLSGLCRRVYLIHRRDEFRGAQVAVERLRGTPNVEFVLSSIVTRITGSSRVEQIEVRNRKNNADRLIQVSGVFIYVGSIPNSDWCASLLERDEAGFIKTDQFLRTNVAGIFAAGDVRTTPLRQIVTAVGDGALAAMQAHQYLADMPRGSSQATVVRQGCPSNYNSTSHDIRHWEQTLLLIKPDAVSGQHIGEVLQRVEKAGFRITGLVMRQLSRAEAGKLYAIHRGKEFFSGLVDFIVSGPVVAVRLAAPSARERLREFVGATDPARAAPGTIRRDFGTSVRQNSVHASNPAEDVENELALFFGDSTKQQKEDW